MSKKPVVLIDSFHLIQSLTGIRTYTTQLLTGLEELEQTEIKYIVYPNWRCMNHTEFLRGKVNPLKKILNHILYFLWKQCCLPIIILFKRVDVVVSLDYLLPCFKFRAKSITVVHDTFYWELKGKYNPVWRSYFLKSVKLGLDSKSEIIVTTDYIADKVKRWVTDEHKTFVVYQAPKDLYSEKDWTITLRKIGLPDGAKYFLHIGIFEERKNLEILVRAFHEYLRNKASEDFFLVLAGGKGVGIFHDNFSKITQLIKELGLEDRVLLPGFVPDDQLKALYENAFAYIFPSKEEGFGIPVIEAMKSGTPVIISNQPALMEVAGGAALIFDMDRYDSLLDRMNELMDEELRLNLIEKGKLNARKFGRRSFAEQFHRVVWQRTR